MAMTPISGMQSATAGIWVQLQQQQAQRVADQAEMKARSLQAQARDAQMTAAQAQENARTLSVRADQASGEASNAKLGLAQSSAMAKTQGQLGEWHQQLTSMLTNTNTATTPVPTSNPSAQPVLNASGQTTGAVISVTA